MAAKGPAKSVLSEPADIGKSPITSDKDKILPARQLKKNRSTAKGLVTRKRNEITELLLTSIPKVDELKKKAEELETVMEKFRVSHADYHETLKDEEDIEESNEYFDAEQARVHLLMERITNVIDVQSSIVPPVITPYDSVSQAGKSKSSHSKRSSASQKSEKSNSRSPSVKSTTSSTKAKAAAKKAALEVEAANYKKRMALQQEELQLQQKQELLNLEIEIQKANAEEQAFIAIEKEEEKRDSQPVNHQNVTQPTPPTKIDQPPGNKHKHEQHMPVKGQPLNPTANEWSRTSNSGGPNETSQSNDNGTVLHQQLERMVTEQQRYTAALSLPQPEVPVFRGQPIEYCSFIRAFENLIESKTDSSSSRLYYLVQYTAGDVQELMRSCLVMSPDEGYQEARRLLKEKYGQNYKIAAAYVDRLTSGPPIRSEDGNALQKFSVLLTSCKNALKDIGYLNKLENPDALRKVVERLPYALRQKWREVVDDVIQRQNRDITVEDIAIFVEKRARVATHPIFGNITSDSKNNDSNKQKNRFGNTTPRSGSSFGTNADFNQQPPPGTSNVKCQLCSQNHRLYQCPDFRKKSLEERLQFVRKKGLCNNCFAHGHLAKTCEMPSFCRVKGCQFKHSTFLHPKSNTDDKGNDAAKPPENVNSVTNNQDRPLETVVQSAYVNTGENLQSHKPRPQRVTSLAIVPVKVKARNSSMMIETYAFLDGGSNTTFCTERLMEQLQATKKSTILSLTTMTQEDCTVESSVVSLELFDLQGDNFIDLPTVFSTAKLPVSRESMATQRDADQWSHLKDIEIPDIDAEVSLLIGSDVPQALEPLEIRRGQKGEPYATRTALGWVVNGPLGRTGSAPHSASYATSADVQLNEQFEKFCNMEFNDSAFSNKTSMSQEDRRALEIMNKSITLKDGHYELALPWRQCPPELPSNKSLAEHRLNLLKRRLRKDPLLHGKYTEFMNDLLRKGYAKRASNDQLKELNRTTWYLPHHPVFHPQKPDKVRVVFDCSAKYRGTSLNDQILQGPDLTNTLVGVLTRFREEPVALMSDVEAMFHQVKVRPDDCNALRFLWWPDGDLDKEAEEFQMTVHLFGGTSSPSCANFALRRTAEDNVDDFDPETIATIQRNFYVDDCLKSVKSASSAVRLADQLSACLAKGGFRLTKWISNSSAVIESIPESERAPSIRRLDFDKSNHVERPLGVQWNVATDTFGFTISIKDRPLTRRGVLSTVSSIYDPMGFAAPFILPAKAILQDLCRKKLGWDDPVPPDEAQRWQKWLEELPKLEKLAVDRCFKPSEFGEITSRQLHHFSDASQQGYGAVSYLRIANAQGDIHCSFVLGKARLSPLKPMTIPRMELSAAVVATRLENMIQQELEEKPTCKSVFWSDSTCVLRYVENEDKRFQTFVANRIATIRDASMPIQWRYVDTKSNPADDASRGLSVDAFLEESRWLKGPQFLWLPEEKWPQRPPGMNVKIEDDDPEVKKEAKNCATRANVTTNTLTTIFERISSWHRLKKFAAWMMRCKERLKRLRAKKKSGQSTTLELGDFFAPLSLEEMDQAEKEILKHVQRESFPEEVSNPSLIKKSSAIFKLDPCLTDDMLRVGGRLRHAPIEADAKYPVILPKKHHVTKLIIREYHERCGHSGLEYVLSLLRQRFWIIKARRTIRQVLDSCFSCRKRQAPVGTQKMADLPKDRVTPNIPPFTNVGVDCFGPVTVRRGRSTVKRYGVLFTCLSCRAVHIEVAHSLDTHSFINALRRFISRRGQPKEIRSDNGSNFVGGEKELREAVELWNQQQIHEFLLQESTKWTFNPPAGSHHGGVWERCIRTVRKVLAALLKEQTLDDEGLLTLMCEVESIVNGRPITKISDDPRDYEALTPNHLLLLRSGPVLPPATLVKQDQYSSRWRQVQYLADVFWRRWLREYLPSLQQRQKWNVPTRNFTVGDIVLVVDEKYPRGSWPLGLVQEVYPNKHDGHVRRVKVKTMKSILERPVDKIVLLESAVLAADK